MEKQLLSPERLRKIPAQFSWIDQRLVRDRHIDRITHPAAALYLFLLTVSDKSGLSYYSARSIGQRLAMSAGQLEQARAELQRADLIVYRDPLYQVLCLERGLCSQRGAGIRSLKDILTNLGAPT
jgi:hypothetical protein